MKFGLKGIKVFHTIQLGWMDRFEVAQINAPWYTFSKQFEDFSIQDICSNGCAFIFPT